MGRRLGPLSVDVVVAPFSAPPRRKTGASASNDGDEEGLERWQEAARKMCHWRW